MTSSVYMCVWYPETRRSEDLEHVAEEEQCLQIQACSRKLSVIKDVLARRHMKVAFFGR